MKMKLKPITITGLVLMISMILVMGGLFGYSFVGASEDNPVIVFYGFDGAFPVQSMRNTIHAEGFDYVIEDAIEQTDGYVFELDDDYEDRDVVVVATGKCSVYALSFFSEHGYDNVCGYVLIDPVSPGNLVMEGLSETIPSQNVAIFAGKDEATNVSDISGSRLIYERLSGADTVYGAAFRSGTIFASTCYSDASQNRYLSLSAFNSSDGDLVFSPLFQSEFARYLESTYGDIASPVGGTGRVSSWFCVMALAPFLAIAGFCLILAALPTYRTRMSMTSEEKSEKNVFVVVTGITVALLIGVIVLSLFEKLRHFIYLALLIVPVIYIVIMLISKLGFIFDNRIKYKPNPTDKIKTLLMIVVEVLFAFLCSLLYFGLFNESVDLVHVLFVVVASVIDFVASSALSYADKKARFDGQTGCSYFGNMAMPAYIILPSLFVFMFGVVFSLSDLITAGFGGMMIGLLPFVFALPIRRHSDSPFVTGFVHAAVYFLLFICFL